MDFDEELLEIANNEIPEKWKTLAYLSSNNLIQFILNLTKRIQFMNVSIFCPLYISLSNQKFLLQSLLGEDRKTFPLSSLYRIKPYLIGVLQDYASTTGIPIEKLRLELSWNIESENIKYEGLFLDLWDNAKGKLSGGELNVKLKDMGKFGVIVIKDESEKEEQDLMCPLYLTPLRRGDLRKTGRNPNFIGVFKLNYSPDTTLSQWIKYGVAMSCQVDEG